MMKMVALNTFNNTGAIVRNFKSLILIVLLLSGGFTVANAQSFWTTRTYTGTANILVGVAWSGSQIVAIGGGGTFLLSSDGITWAQGSLPTTSEQEAITYGRNQFVSVGVGGSIMTWQSGGNWTSRTSGTTNNLNAVIWTGSQFAAVGNGGTLLLSADGISWGIGTTPVSTTLYGIAWTGSQFVIVGNGGLIMTSPNGTTWTQQTSGTGNNLYALTWTGTQLVAVGVNGTILTSTNGGTWFLRNSGTPQLGSVTWTGSQFVAVGSNIMTSLDAVAWAQRTSSTANYLYRVASTPNQVVAVGSTGTIITSAQDLPTVPTLSNPAQNATSVPVSTGLTWVAFSGATSYRLQLSTDSTFATIIVNDSTLTTTTRSVGTLLNSTTYYWRVNATSAGGISQYSVVSRFNTVASTAVLPDEFATQRLNFENGNSLRFSLSQQSHVVIRIFNSEGRMVSQLLNETRGAGNYSVPFSMELKGSYYLLDFRADGFHKTLQLQGK